MLNPTDQYQSYRGPDDCYLNIGSSPFIKDWFDQHFGALDFSLDVYHWKGCHCPKDVWLQEPILSKIHSQFPIKRAGFLLLEPNRCYDWHIDVSRGLTINSSMAPLLKSVCAFGRPTSIAHLDFIELKYQPNAFYLFNTQVPHMVMNWEEPRYMFGVEFEQDKTNLTYQQVKDWLTNNP